MTTNDRDWLTTAGLWVVGASTVIASFSALAGLAVAAGWDWRMSILLPATVDVYGVTSTRIWLSPASSSEVRSHARFHALAALVLSMGGNAVNHAIEAHALVLGRHLWLLVVAVSLVPPAALGSLMHLIAVRSRHRNSIVEPNRIPVAAPAAQTGPPPSLQTGSHAVAGPRSADTTQTQIRTQPETSTSNGSQTQVRDPGPETSQTTKPKASQTGPKQKPASPDRLKEARAVNKAYLAEHGRPIPAEKLRQALGIGKPAAIELVKQIRGAHMDVAK